MAYWLVKTESTTYSIDDLKRDGRTFWDGVRNYQARNFLREMRKGDLVFIYHSVTDPIGIAGLAKVVAEATPDPTQFDKKSKYFDKASSQDKPRWFAPELKFEKKFSKILSLAEIKESRGLDGLELLRRGSRLSVQPVEGKHFKLLSGMTS